MPTGKIKWFSQQIGAGFIISDEGENVFFRCNKTETIQRGQCVSFDIVKNRKTISKTATNVKTIDNNG